MNNIFRIVWSEATQTWVAVSELTKAHKKKGSSKGVAAAVVTAALGLGVGQFAAAAGDGALQDGRDANASGSGAIAFGREAEATDTNSVAIGVAAKSRTLKGVALGSDAEVTAEASQGVAIGAGSKTEGAQGLSFGVAANAKGKKSIAIGSGDVDPATGKAKNDKSNPIATGDYSVAFGSGAQALKNGAMAFGFQSYSEEINSLSFGNNAVAKGDNSIAIGSGETQTAANGTVTSTGAAAGGARSIAIGRLSRAGQDDTIAIGTNAATQGNGAVAIGGSNDNQKAAQAYAVNAVAIGVDTTANQANAVAISESSAAGQRAVAAGKSTAKGDNAVALGGSIADTEGSFAAAGSTTSGIDSSLLNNGNRETISTGGTGKNQVAIGGSISNGEGAVAIGGASQSIGDYAAALAYGRALGDNAVAMGNSQAGGDNSVALGGSRAKGNGSFAVSGAKTDGQNTLAFGMNSLATGTGTIAMGYGAEAGGDSLVKYQDNPNEVVSRLSKALAIGYTAKANGVETVALGNATNAAGDRAIAIGSGASAPEGGNVAIGHNAQGNGLESIAIGRNALAGYPTKDGVAYEGAIAIGRDSRSAVTASVAIGASAHNDTTNSSKGYEVAIGYGAQTYGGGYATAVGEGAKAGNASGYASAFGRRATATGTAALALGAHANADGNGGIAIGTASYDRSAAAGAVDNALKTYGTRANGQDSLAIGGGARATASNTVGIGERSNALKDKAVAMGKESIAAGAQSLALGDGAIAGATSKDSANDFIAKRDQYLSLQDARTAATQSQTAANNRLTAAQAGVTAANAQKSASDAQLVRANAMPSGSLKEQVDKANAITAAQQAIKDAQAAQTVANTELTNAQKAVSDANALVTSTTSAYDSYTATYNAASNATVAKATAIGSGAMATKANGVALGADSVTTGDAGAVAFNPANGRTNKYIADGTGDRSANGRANKSSLAGVSVGNADQTRQINNLAGGTVDTDAVNVAQLKSVNLAVSGDDNTKGDVRLYDQKLQIVGGDNVTTKVEGNKVTISTTVPSVSAGPNIKYFSVNSSGGGNENNDGATDNDAIAIGKNAKSQSPGAIAMGWTAVTNANSTDSIALGSSTQTTGDSAVAIGKTANALAQKSTAIGLGAKAVSNSSIAFGEGATINGGTVNDNSHSAIAIGRIAKANGLNSVALGVNTQTNGVKTVAIGSDAVASNENATAVGAGANAATANSLAMGNNTLAGTARAVAEQAKFNAMRTALGNQEYTQDINDTSLQNSAQYVSTYRTAVQKLSAAEKAELEKAGIDVAALQKEAADMTVENLGSAAHTEMDKVTKLFSGNYPTLRNLISAANSYNSRISAATANGEAVTKAKQAVDTAQAELDKLTGRVAIGNASAASGERSTAIGIGATATGINSLALGYGSAVEFSVNSTADNAKGSTAIGQNARVQDSANSIALGTGAMIGVHEQGQPRTNTHDSIAIGSGANTLGSQNIVIGKNASAFSSRTDLNNVIHTDVNAVAIGTNAYVFDNAGVAIGQGARVNSSSRTIGAIGGVALGGGSVSDRQNSLANLQTISFDGYKPEATRERKYITNFDPYTARNNTNVAEYNMSEYSTLVATAGAVSVGDSSTTHEVSISGTKVLAPITRQIINVAAGDNDSDAVNVAQLKSVNLKVVADSRNYQGEGGGRNFGNTNSDGANLFLDREVLNIAGDSSSFTTTESKFVTITDSNKAKDGLEAGATGKKSSESYLQVKVKNKMANVIAGSDGKSRYAVAGDTKYNGLVSGETLNSVANNIFWTLKSDDDSRNTKAGSLQVKAGTQVALKDSTNLTVTHKKDSSEAQYSFDLRPDVTLGTAKTGNQSGTAGSVTVNGGSGQIVKINGSDGSLTLSGETKQGTNPETKTVVNDKGITITPVLELDNKNGTYSPSTKKPVSLTQNGLDNGDNKIINVAQGTADTDAVNVSQLNAWKVKYFSVNSTGGGNEDNKGAKGTDSIAIGKDANTDSANKDNGSRNMAIGNGATVTVLKQLPKVADTDEDDKTKIITDAIALGTNATTSAKDTVVIGHGASSTGDASISLGLDTSTGGSRNIAIGKNASVNAGNGTGEAVGSNQMVDSIAIGTDAKASAKNAVVIGNGAKSIRADKSFKTGENAIAIGTSADASYTHSIALGTEATAGQTEGIAIGNKAKSTSGNKASVAVGTQSEATGSASAAFGALAKSTGLQSTAIGREATASNTSAIAVGYQAKAQGLNTVAIGNQANAQNSRGSVVIGDRTTSLGEAAIAIGRQASNTSRGAISMGDGAKTTSTNAIAMGTSSVSAGANAIALGNSAKAFDDNNIAIGNAARSSGSKAIAMGQSATTTDGTAIGFNAIAAGSGSLSFGKKAVVGGFVFKDKDGKDITNKDVNAKIDPYIKQYDVWRKAVENEEAIKASSTATDQEKKNAEDATKAAKGALEAIAAPVSDALAFGTNSSALKTDAIAIGHDAVANSQNGIAIGLGAKVSTQDGVALGAGSSASVAKGSKAFDPAASRTNYYKPVRGEGEGAAAVAESSRGAVDIGGRQITSVAGGSADTDAVNVAQLKGVALGFTGNSGKGDVRLYDQDLAVVGAGTGDSQYIKTSASDKKIEIDLSDAAKRAIDNKISLGGDTGNTNEIKLSNEGGIKFNVKGAKTGTGAAATSYITTSASGSDVSIDLSDDAKTKLNRTYNVVGSGDNVHVTPNTNGDVTTFTVKVDPNKISAGKNITISGDGTTANPYKIVAADQVEQVKASTDADNIAEVSPATGSTQGAKNATYEVKVSKQAIQNIAKAADSSIASKAYAVDDKGTVTMTYVDGNGQAIPDRQATITGVARADMKNITEDGKKVITGLGTVVKAGTNITSVNEVTDANGQRTYKIDAAAQVESVAKATAVAGDTNIAEVAPITGTDGAANTKYGVSVSKNAVKDAAREAVTVNTDTNNTNNPITVTPTQDGTNHTTSYSITFNGDNSAKEIPLTYKANGRGDKTVKLDKGLDFTNGERTVASIKDNGVVTFDLNDDTKNKIDNAANKNLSNITNEGNKVIHNIARGAVEVVNGQNTTVTHTPGSDTTPDKYAVNVQGDLTKVTSITNESGNGKVSFGADGVVTISNGADGKAVAIDGKGGYVTGLQNREWVVGKTQPVNGRAATEDQLKVISDTVDGGLKFGTQSTGDKSVIAKKLGEQLDIVGGGTDNDDKYDATNIKTMTTADGKVKIALAKTITADEVKIGKDGKDGVDGKIGVNGKDGSAVVINGKDGSIGLTGPKGADGKDGATTTINVAPGRDGKDGAPGTKGLDGKITTRIEYKDGNNTHTVATLDDGQKYGGDNYVASTTTEAEKNVIAKKLNERLDIIGGAKQSDLTENNIGVNAENGKLKVQLAKNIDLTGTGSVTTGNTKVNNDGVTVKDGANQSTMGKDGVKVVDGTNTSTVAADGMTVDNGKTSTTVGADTVRIGGTKGASNAITGGITIGDQVVTNNQVQPKEEKGKFITGLDNKTWSPDTDGIVSGRAATEDQLQAATNVVNTKGLNFKGNTGDAVHKDLGQTLEIVGKGTKDNDKYDATNIKTYTDNGKLVVALDKDIKTTSVTTNTITVGEKGEQGQDGKAGVDGTIGVNGKDGSAVVINGKDGSIGLNGKDGANGLTIKGADGKAGVDGKDGVTRIVYETKDGNNTIKHEVATLDDGQKYGGDNYVAATKTEAEKNVIAKKLNERLDIIGGADATKLTENNIGVNAKDGKLQVQLAKNVDLTETGSVTTGNAVMNNDGWKVTSGNNVSTVGANGVTVVNGTNGTTVGADTVRIGGTKGANNAITGGITIGDQVVTNNQAQPKEQKGKYVTGLDNKTWTPDTDGIVSGRAATEDQLQAATNAVNTKGLNFQGNTGDAVHKDLGETLEIVGKGTKDNDKYDATNIKTYTEDGKLVVALDKDIKTTSVTTNTITVGEKGEKGQDGKDGVDGTIGVNGKDGSAVVINGKNGSIGLNGKDGANGLTIKGDKGAVGLDGTDGKDGKDGMTRIVYTDKNDTKHEVATLDDGQKYGGDNYVAATKTEAEKNVIAKKLNERLDIIGGADATKLTENNIGVNAKDGKLKVQLAKNLDLTKEGSITTGNAVMNKDGWKITNGNNVSTTVGTNGVTVDNGKTSTTVGADTVRIGGTKGANNAITGGITIGDQVVTNNQAQPKEQKGKYVTGLDNKTWSPDTDGIVSGRAATEDQLQIATNQVNAKGLNFKGNTGDAVHKDLGQTLEIVGKGTKDNDKYDATNIKTYTEDGKLIVALDKDIKTTSVTTNTITVGEKGEAGKDGKPGKDGVDGTIGVNGKDGSAVVINGKDGSIGLNGKDGANGLTIKGDKGAVGVDGTDGKDGKDGMTRIVYTDKNDTKHEVATLDDGQKYGGDNYKAAEGDKAEQNVIAKKLNERLDIIGGADATKLTDKNIGVNNVDGKLKVQLAKNLTDLESIIVKGKDGAGVQINGEDGTIGLDGRDGKNGLTIAGDKGAAGVDGTDGANGKDGMTRIVYTDNNNTTHEVATLDDGLKFTGNNSDTTNIHKLNSLVTIEGEGVDKEASKAFKSASGNINVVADGTSKLTVQLSKNLTGLDTIDVNTVTVGKDGKDGVNGTIIVKGKDGAGVQINGEDGTIGLDGRDGKNGLTIAGDKGAAGVDGTDGANGKDGMTRIVYTDNNNTTHEVATLDDGMKYAGDDAQGTDKSKVLIKKLNNTVDIVGGADKDKLTDNNIGVNNVDGKLKVQLSKELKDLSSAQFKDKNGNTTEVTGEGMTITDGNNHVVIHDANGTLMSDGKNSSLSTANGYSVMDDKGNVAEFSAGGTTISDDKGNTSLHSAGNSIFTNGDVSTIVGPNGVTITPSNGSGAEVTLTDKGLNNGGNKITNVAEGTEDTDAVNVSQLEKAKKAATTTITVNDNNTAKNWNLNLTESKAEDGHINYDISLADVVTLGEGANRVKLDGLKGQVTAGGILIGNQITSTNHAQPKDQKGNFITGLENKTWNPKTDGIVSGRAATEDQLKIVSDKANQVAENTIGFTGDNQSATDKQALSKDGGISFNIAGGADKDKLSDNNIGVNAKGSTVEVKLAKDLKGLNSAEFTDGKGNTTKINSEGTVITDGKNTARSTASGYTVTDGTNSTTMTSNGIVINPSNGDSKASVSLTNNGLHNGGNKITGVAAGDISPTSTDAVNGSQLYKTTQEFTTKGMNFVGNDKQSIHKNLGETMNIIGGGTKDNKEYDASNVKTFKDDKGNLVVGLDKNLKAETITTKTVTTETVNTKEVKTDAITINGKDGKDGVTIKGETGKDGETRIVYTDGKDGKDGKSHTVATLDDGMKFAGDDKKVIDKKLGEQLDIHGGADANNLTDNNIGVVSDNKALKVKLAKNIKGVDSISKGEGKGGITLQDKGVRIDGGDLDMSNHKVTNVAPGRVAADSKDAVNGSQLHATNQVVINNARNIAALDNKINHVDRNLRAGIAGALASGGLYQANTPGKSMVSAGVGTYKGESAVAVGYSRMSDNGKIGIKFSVNSNTRGDNGAAASVGYQW